MQIVIGNKYMKKNNTVRIITIILTIIVTFVIILQIYNLFVGPSLEISATFFAKPDYVPVIQLSSKPKFTGTIDDFPKKQGLLSITEKNNSSWLSSLDAYCAGSGNCSKYVFDDIVQLLMKNPDYTVREIDQATAQIAADNLVNQIYIGEDVQPKLSSSSLMNEELNGYIDTDIDEVIETFEDVQYADLYDEIEEEIDESVNTEMVAYYNLSYQDFPIFHRIYGSDQIMVTVGSDYQPTVLEAPLNLYSINQIKSYKTINIDKALSNIYGGNAYYISYISDEDDSKVTLVNVILESVQLEYRLDDEQAQAIPCYRFSGTATNDHDERVDIEIITPAINFTVTP